MFLGYQVVGFRLMQGFKGNSRDFLSCIYLQFTSLQRKLDSSHSAVWHKTTWSISLFHRVPAPHVVAARAYRISSPGGSGTPLYRLSRLLNQGSKTQIVVDDSNTPRRLSWERWAIIVITIKTWQEYQITLSHFFTASRATVPWPTEHPQVIYVFLYDGVESVNIHPVL